MWWGFVVPCKITWCRIIVLPLRRAFLYIKLATDLGSKASIDPGTYRADQEEENEETKAGRLRSGLRE